MVAGRLPGDTLAEIGAAVGVDTAGLLGDIIRENSYSPTDNSDDKTRGKEAEMEVPGSGPSFERYEPTEGSRVFYDDGGPSGGGASRPGDPISVADPTDVIASLFPLKGTGAVASKTGAERMCVLCRFFFFFCDMSLY